MLFYFLGNKLYILFKLDKQTFKDLFYLLIFSSLFGGRIGHIVLYEWDLYKDDMLQMLYVWQGGMSFFGSFIVSLIAIYIYSSHYKKDFFLLSDFILFLAPIFIFIIRIGNFINNDLVTYDKFNLLPHIGLSVYQINISLVEAFLEAFILFILLLFMIKRQTKTITIFFLYYYSCIRFLIEFLKQDSMINKYISVSQILCILMGLLAIYFSIKKPKKENLTQIKTIL